VATLLKEVIPCQLKAAALDTQLKTLKEDTKAQTIQVEAAHKKESNQQAQEQQWRLISEHLKRANYKIPTSSPGQLRAGLQAFQDPSTKSLSLILRKLKK